jgi:hypothetical protein
MSIPRILVELTDDFAHVTSLAPQCSVCGVLVRFLQVHASEATILDSPSFRILWRFDLAISYLDAPATPALFDWADLSSSVMIYTPHSSNYGIRLT